VEFDLSQIIHCVESLSEAGRRDISLATGQLSRSRRFLDALV